MVDFATIRENNRKRAEAELAARKDPLKPKTLIVKTDLEIINECIPETNHEWTSNFLLSIKQWLMRRETNYLSAKQTDKLYEIAEELGVRREEPPEAYERKYPKNVKRTIVAAQDDWDDLDNDIPF